MHDFRKLIVYQRALTYSKTARAVTEFFPKEEAFVLSSQLRRASDSIVLNLAEGAGNSSQKEFRKFIGYSIRSGYECLGCVDIAHTNGFIDNQNYNTLRNEADEIISMLIGLQRKVH